MKLLLLDKDGTLVRSTNGTFINRPWHQEVIPGVRETLDRYLKDGWMPVIISNQGGIEANHKSLESAIFEMQFCMELLPIQFAYFCPDFAGAECWYVWGDCSEDERIHLEENDFVVMELDIKNQLRKPNAGMLKLAIADHGSGASDILYVGDMTISNSPKGEDENAAIAAGVRSMSAEEWRTIEENFVLLYQRHGATGEQRFSTKDKAIRISRFQSDEGLIYPIAIVDLKSKEYWIPTESLIDDVESEIRRFGEGFVSRGIYSMFSDED